MTDTERYLLAAGIILLVIIVLDVATPKKDHPRPSFGGTFAPAPTKPQTPSDSLRQWLDDNFEVVPCGCD